MTKGIQNGQRLPVNFTMFQGTAGVQDRGDGLYEVAYAAKQVPRVGSKGGIDGSPVTVLTAQRSELIGSMVLLMVERD